MPCFNTVSGIPSLQGATMWSKPPAVSSGSLNELADPLRRRPPRELARSLRFSCQNFIIPAKTGPDLLHGVNRPFEGRYKKNMTYRLDRSDKKHHVEYDKITDVVQESKKGLHLSPGALALPFTICVKKALRRWPRSLDPAQKAK